MLGIRHIGTKHIYTQKLYTQSEPTIIPQIYRRFEPSKTQHQHTIVKKDRIIPLTWPIVNEQKIPRDRSHILMHFGALRKIRLFFLHAFPPLICLCVFSSFIQMGMGIEFLFINRSFVSHGYGIVRWFFGVIGSHSWNDLKITQNFQKISLNFEISKDFKISNLIKSLIIERKNSF